VPALLGAGSASCFTELAKCLQASTELIRRFVGEAQVRSLVVQKLLMKEQVSFVVLSELQYVNPKCQSVQLIKGDDIVETDKPFDSQLCVISLSDASPYKTLHGFLSNSLSPYFK